MTDIAASVREFLDLTVTDVTAEIALDRHCAALLKQFHQQLLAEGIDALEAGSAAHGADYFSRDFAVGHCRRHPADIDAGAIRAFAGHWYITRNLEPNLEELSAILQGVSLFYTFLHQHNVIDDDHLEQARAHCCALDYYRERIDSFWELDPDGYNRWCTDCPLPPQR